MGVPDLLQADVSNVIVDDIKLVEHDPVLILLANYFDLEYLKHQIYVIDMPPSVHKAYIA